MKGNRRQEAMKRDKRKKRIIAAVCGAVLVTIAVLLIVGHVQQRGTRTFISGRNSVTLNADGTFRAVLPHGVERSGTFTETTTDGVTTVSFNQGGTTVHANIEDNVLTIPDEWDDGHGHPRNYTLQR